MMFSYTHRTAVLGFTLVAAVAAVAAVAVTPSNAQTKASGDGSMDSSEKCDDLSPIYQTKGVHSPCYCGADECVEKRTPEDPTDPKYPDNWVSEWTMFRVFNNYQQNLPPYANPPQGLHEGTDYEVSYGATYYDNNYTPPDGDGYGAMMEFYDKRCLPIFPIDNHFTCSFISLGNNAYFLTYEQDRPADMPACCLFSPYNHPPRPDFIKHLPYSAEDSGHLGNQLQAYRYIAGGPGAGIWFAYAFYKDQWLDKDKQYLQPQSFYFSGSPTDPPEAPFVSQNYSNFHIKKPDPGKTWHQVRQMCPANPPPCQLFDPPAPATQKARAVRNTNWGNLNLIK